jgi:hypothetical protein
VIGVHGCIHAVISCHYQGESGAPVSKHSHEWPALLTGLTFAVDAHVVMRFRRCTLICISLCARMYDSSEPSMVLSFMRISPVSCSCRLHVQLCIRPACRQLMLMQNRDKSLMQTRDRLRGLRLQSASRW